MPNDSAAPAVIKEFANYMTVVKGRSPRTVEQYTIDLMLMFRYITAHRVGELPPDGALSSVDILSGTEEKSIPSSSIMSEDESETIFLFFTGASDYRLLDVENSTSIIV